MSENEMNSEQPIVSLKDVHKSFGDLEVLKGISFDVKKGEVICIIGPSGSGKSTLIRCINALNDINSGSIKVHGREVHDPKLDKLELRKKVGMVFQQFNLFPHKTALENVMMAPVLVLKQNKEEVRKRAEDLIRKVRLQGKDVVLRKQGPDLIVISPGLVYLAGGTPGRGKVYKNRAALLKRFADRLRRPGFPLQP